MKWIDRQVARAVAAGRVGTPVALRAFLYLSEDHGRLMETVGAVLAAAGGWFSSPARRLYALGGAAHGEITVLAEFAGGQTALISAGLLRGPAPLANILVIGNKGTLRFEGPAVPEPAPPAVRRLLSAVERSLASGAAVEVG